MADNFNLRQFLTENKLTKNAKLLKENEEGDGWKTFDDSGIEGLYMDTVDGVKIYSVTDSSVYDYCAYVLEYPDGKTDIVDLDVSGEPISSEELQEYETLSDKPKIADFIAADIARELGEEGEGEMDETAPALNETMSALKDKYRGDIMDNKLGQKSLNAALEKDAEYNKLQPSEQRKLKTYLQGILNAEYNESKQPVAESKLTAKERRLVEMVQDALGLEGYGDDNVIAKLEKRGEVPVEEPTYTEGEEMVKEKPLPKYESIEQLMKEIEHGTNEAAHKYKMEEMKRVYEALEAKVSSLEEGENAEHIDQKKVKQMRKDIAALRKAEEKLRKEFDKKFSDKEKKEAPKKEKEDVTLAENKKRNTMKNFDLKKFLTENKLTTNSRMLTEQAQYKDGDTVDIEGDNWRVYKAFSGNKDNMAAALEFVKQNIQILPFEQWYEGEFGGGRPVRTSEPVYILTGMDEKGMGIEHGPQIVLQDDIDDGYLSYGNTGELEGDYQDEL